MTEEEERRAILAAMGRLFAGTPLRSSGSLDIVALAEEAGLKRNKLTHKHTDLKERFYAERRARDGVTEREAKLQSELALLRARFEELREERDHHRSANEVFARALHVLTVENDSLRKELGKAQASKIRPLCLTTTPNSPTKQKGST